jgi:hypothetical protein
MQVEINNWLQRNGALVYVTGFIGAVAGVALVVGAWVGVVN